MKKNTLSLKSILFFIAAAVLMAAYAGCGDNVTGGNLFGTNTVSFTMGTQQGPNGGTQFTWTPNQSVKVTMLVLSTTGFSDTITDNSGQLYTGGTAWAYPQEYTGVATGQQWQFNFTGTDSSNTAYTSTASLTIP